MGTCTLEIEVNNKHEMYTFFVVVENRQALLAMPDIDVLNVININITSIGTEHGGGKDNCCTNEATAQRTDMMPERSRTEKCYTITGSILKSDNTDKTTVNNKLSNTKGYFLPGPNCDSDKKKSAEITQQLQRDFKDVFNGIGSFDGTFELQLKLDSKPYHEMCSICTTETF